MDRIVKALMPEVMVAEVEGVAKELAVDRAAAVRILLREALDTRKRAQRRAAALPTDPARKRRPGRPRKSRIRET